MKMQKTGRIYRFLFASISILMMLFTSTTIAKAEVPYETFSVNGFGRTIFTQPAYKPYGVFTQDIYVPDENGELVYSSLNQPKDFHIDKNDHIYIADTGNNRIIHLDDKGGFLQEFKVEESPLNQPNGIFIDQNGDIFIADTGNKRVIQLDKNGKLVKEFNRPESKYLDDKFVYEPINMIVDRRGIVYVASRGTYQGIIQLTPEGDFYGFFGTNLTEVSVMDRVRNMLYTEEQLSRQVRLLPNAIRNITIDKEGYIYTASRGTSEQIKKINVRGENQWKAFSFNESINLSFLRMGNTVGSEEEAAGTTDITDITVDAYGIVTVIDKANAIVAQFDRDGELLFFWGAPFSSGTPQVGVTNSPVAVETNSKNQVFILDDVLNVIQVLEPTEFGADIQQAHILSQEGKYRDSEEYWHKISRQNAVFSPAYAGLARAAFYEEDYDEAMRLFQLAGDAEGYSDAFWQIRLNWFQKNFGLFANAFIVIGVGTIAGSRIVKRRKRKKKKKEAAKWLKTPIIVHLRHALSVLRHPLEEFSNIRYLNKGNYLSALLVLVLVVLVAITRIYFTSFTFQPVPIGSLNAGSIVISGTVIWVSWVICHYLIGSIRYGQARFREVFIGSAYALLPVIILGLPLAVLSNVMTLSENSIYLFFSSLIYIWSALLFFWMVQSLQNYSVGETIASILLSLFSMIMLWVLIFIIFGLASETLEFIYTLYQEVTM